MKTNDEETVPGDAPKSSEGSSIERHASMEILLKSDTPGSKLEVTCSIQNSSEEKESLGEKFQTNLQTSSEGDLKEGSDTHVGKPNHDEWESCDEKPRKSKAVKSLAKNRVRKKGTGRRNIRNTGSLHDSMLLENSLARILEALSPALSPLVRGSRTNVENPCKIPQISLASSPMSAPYPVEGTDTTGEASELRTLPEEERAVHGPTKLPKEETAVHGPTEEGTVKTTTLQSSENAIAEKTKSRANSKITSCSPTTGILPADNRTVHRQCPTEAERLQNSPCTSSRNELIDSTRRGKQKIRSCSQPDQTLLRPALKTGRMSKHRAFSSQPVRTGPGSRLKTLRKAKQANIHCRNGNESRKDLRKYEPSLSKDSQSLRAKD